VTRAAARLRAIAHAAGLAAGGEVANAPARVAAFARVALVPLLLAAEALETPRSAPDLALAGPALIAYVVFAVVSLAYTLRARCPVPLAPFAIADTLLLAVLLLGEGGAPADMRFALSVPVLVAAFVAGPRLTLQLALLSLAGFAAAAIVSPTFGHEAPARYVVVHTFDLAWRGALAVVLSVFLARRSARIRALAESRRSLVAQALGAEARARRELAYVLHDELVQGLLSAQQDIKRARRGHAELLDRAEDGLATAVAQLRAQILHLHPHQLESAGLGAALDAVAAGLRLADDSHPVVAVTAAAAAADADSEVLFSVGRELLTNAVRHAGARNVALSVDVDGAHVVVCCTDDGGGMTHTRRREALAHGHLGLAASTERVEALGGSLEIVSAPEQGTRVRVLVPVARPDTPPVAASAPAAVAAAVALGGEAAATAHS
jgi:two-component system, NarL family, sensor kinase